MAYIRKLPSGKFNAVVRHPSGRRLSHTDSLRRVVVEWAARKEAEFRSGLAPAETARKTTVRQWHARWIQARTLAATTAHEENLRLDAYVLPYWGDWPLASIGRIDIQSWVKKLTDERSAHVAVGCYRVLHKMLADAELEGVLPTSPCRKIELPKLEKPAPRWLSREEYDRLLLAFEGAPQGQQWQAMVAVACNSGLRSGELAGLDVGAVDFERNLIHVSQVMTKFGLRSYPKSDSSRRAAPCHPDALRLLWPLVADKPADAPVFPAPRGGRLDQSNFLKTVWHPALRRAGIEPVRAYVTRHTFASWLVQDGVPLWDIAQALGHSSLDFVNRYAFLAPGAHESIRAAWARAPRLTHDASSSASSSDESADQTV